MMLVVALRSNANGGRDTRALAGMQNFKRLAFPISSGKFVTADIDFVYETDRNGRCADHGISTPELLRRIARNDIGGNAPGLADELTELADRLEKEMERIS